METLARAVSEKRRRRRGLVAQCDPLSRHCAPVPAIRRCRCWGNLLDATKVACQRSGINRQASSVNDGNKECQQERTSANCPVAIRAAVKAALHISRQGGSGREGER